MSDSYDVHLDGETWTVTVAEVHPPHVIAASTDGNTTVYTAVRQWTSYGTNGVDAVGEIHDDLDACRAAMRDAEVRGLADSRLARLAADALRKRL